MIGVKAAVINHNDWLCSWYVRRRTFYCWSSSPKSIAPVQSWVKHQTNPSWGTPCKMPRAVSIIKSKRSLRNCHKLQEASGDTTAKCNVVSWMGSWKRKRTLGKNLRKSEYTLDLRISLWTLVFRMRTTEMKCPSFYILWPPKLLKNSHTLRFSLCAVKFLVYSVVWIFLKAIF